MLKHDEIQWIMGALGGESGAKFNHIYSNKGTLTATNGRILRHLKAVEGVNDGYYFATNNGHGIELKRREHLDNVEYFDFWVLFQDRIFNPFDLIMMKVETDNRIEISERVKNVK